MDVRAEFENAQTRLRAAVGDLYGAMNRTGKHRPTEEQLVDLRWDYLDAEETARAMAPDYETVVATNKITEALEPRPVGSPVRIVGRVAASSDPEYWDLDTGRQGYAFSIEDKTGRSIDTCLLFGAEPRRAVERALHCGVGVDLLATVVPVPTGKRTRPLLAIHQARQLSSPLAAIGCTQAEIDDAEKFHRHILQSPGGPMAALISELHELRGVAEAGLSSEFRLAEKATILQSLTTGQLTDANQRAHSLLIGEPGSGKKIITDEHRVLQPVALPVQASTVTRAGLSSGATRRDHKLVAKPGLLPRADLGVLTIEDLHGLRVGHREQIFAVLCEAMENGRVELSNVAAHGFICNTAVHLDLNRRSQLHADRALRAGGPKAELADLGLRADLLTRIDIIIELPSDAKDAVASAEAMLGTVGLSDGSRVKRERRLQVLMGLLRHLHPKVDVPPEHAQRALAELLAPLGECESADLSPSIISRRMSNSMAKLVAASARLHDRPIASQQDVALAVELLTPKVEIIKRIATAQGSRDPRARHAVYRRLYGGTVVQPKQIQRDLNLPRSTVVRDLEAIGTRVGYGKYQITTATPRSHRKTVPVEQLAGRSAAKSRGHR
jgi:hypothetical protein